MLIKNSTRQDIEQALAKANSKFSDNLTFNNFSYEGKTRQGNEKHRVTLRVKDSKGRGAKLGFTGRHTIAACWHAHGVFMDALPKGAIIITAGRTKHPGDVWEDWNTGSIYRPMYFSECCEC